MNLLRNVSTTAFANITTISTTPAQHHDGPSISEDLIIGLTIPLGVLIIVAIILALYYCHKWSRRKRELQKELTPFYAYDQSEAEVVDGVEYGPDTSSVDLMCIVAGNGNSSHVNDNGSANSDECMLVTPQSMSRQMDHVIS